MAVQRGFFEAINHGPVIEAIILSGDMVAPAMPNQGWMGVIVCAVPIDFRLMDTARQRSGLLVQRVAKGSPAARAGIRSADVLLRVNGTQVSYDGSLRVALTGRQMNARVEVDLLRDGKVRSLKVVPNLLG